MGIRQWIASALVLVAAVPGAVVASHLVAGNPESLVTGHTVLASNVVLLQDRPTAFAAIAGLAFVQRRNECVVWMNGLVVFDGSLGAPAPANDNGLDPCGEIGERFLVVAVEAGDCDPRRATAAEFVRDLSFLDPNGATHLVAEMRYVCRGAEREQLGLRTTPFAAVLGGPLDGTRTEYAWVTEPHVPVIDPTLLDASCVSTSANPEPGPLGPDPTNGQVPEPVDLFDDESPGLESVCAYNFALIVDTCNDRPSDEGGPRSAENRCTDGGGREFVAPSPFRGPRFDDTERAVVVHEAPPSEQHTIRDGNSNNWTSPDPDDHREDKTADPCYPPETGAPDCGEEGETDYDPEEDHLTARLDLFVSREGCTGSDNNFDGVDDGARTPLGAEFCRVKDAGALTPLVVNHPGCVSGHNAGSSSNAGDDHPSDAFPEDLLPASPVGNCWDLPAPPDDAPGAG